MTPATSLLHAAATASREDLIRCLHYLTTENDVLRGKLGRRVAVTAGERRRLARVSAPLGKGWLDLIASVAAPATIRRWRHRPSPGASKKAGGPGRPRAPERIAQIVLRLAAENQWGVTRIHGELRKLGLAGSISRTTIRNLLRDNGHDPGPRTGEGTWDDFIQRHRETLWASDFLSKPALTPEGRRDAYVFFVKHIGTKRVWMSPATFHPTTDWVAQQARNFTMFLRDHDLQATHIICDRDTKYRGPFCDVLRGDGIEVVRIAFAAPEMNCHAESFVGTLKRECLNHFVISSIDHMHHLCQQYAVFYNTVRPHRALDNRTISETQVPTAPDDYVHETLVCTKWLGGVLKHYQWEKAA
jgi:putative transposase